MTFRSLLIAGVTAFVLAACSDSPAEVPEIAGEAAYETMSQLLIAFEKSMLDNGLEVVLQVDQSDPSSAVRPSNHCRKISFG